MEQKGSTCNKENYLKAKDAFNNNNLSECLGYYAIDHKVMGGQEGTIGQFLEGIHKTWPGIQIIVEHVLADGNLVMGKCKAVAVHSKEVLGVKPSNKNIEVGFWDLHRFNDEGKIIETWNILDNLAIMKQLGLLATR